MVDYIDFLKEGMTTRNRISNSKDISVLVNTLPNGVTDKITATIIKEDYEYYIILTGMGEYACTCPDNSIRGKVCKHIIATLNKIDDELAKRYVGAMVSKKKFDEIG